MNNPITSSPWGFRFYTPGRYMDFLKKIGIGEICTMFGREFPLSLPPERKETEEFRRMAEDKGVKVIEVATTMDYKKELPLAGLLGAKYFRVCTVWEDTTETFAEVVLLLKDIGKMAEDFGLTVIVENHGGLMTKASTCRRLFEEVGRENVKLNYDPANFLYFGEDPLSACSELLFFIGFTHLKSVKYEEGKPRYCRLKEGVIDYKGILSRLLPAYSGYLGLEYEEPSDVEEGTLDDLNYLKQVLAQAL